MTAFTLFMAVDFGLAVVVAFYSGYLYGQSAGFRAGVARGARVVRFSEEEPTALEGRR